MNKRNPDIRMAGVARWVAGNFLDAHIGARHHAYPVFPPQGFGESGAVPDIEPEIKAARRDPEAFVIAQKPPRNGEALAVKRAVLLDVVLIVPGGGGGFQHR